MNLKMEVLVFIALGRYKMVKNPKDKETAFRGAVESVREDYRPYEDPSDFLSEISLTHDRMPKEMFASFFAKRRAKIGYQEISDSLVSSMTKMETTNEISFESILQKEAAMIAFRDLELMGGVDYANTDTMSPSELRFLGIEEVEKDLHLAQPKPSTVLITTPTITERVKRKVRKIKSKIEDLQFHFPFPDSNQQIEFG